MPSKNVRTALAAVALFAVAGCNITPEEFGTGVRNTGAIVARKWRLKSTRGAY